MSTAISTAETQAIPPKAVSTLKLEAKPSRLVRTSSIDKIRRFNSFICSQPALYVLPAILSWLKSSQTSLQSSMEATIFLFRSVFFNTFFGKLYPEGYKSATSEGLSADKIQRDAKLAFLSIIANFYRKVSEFFASTLLLAIAVYAACILVVLQLALAIYLLYFALLPYGFIFMTACMVTIKYMCYKTMFFFLGQSKLK